MKNMDKAFGYACDKYYHVIYDRDHYGYEQRVEGLLLNYANGNIVLLSDKGMYHIKYKDEILKGIKKEMPEIKIYNYKNGKGV